MLTGILAILALTMQLASSSVLASGGPSVVSDEPAYDPGATVTVTGSGFDADATLTVIVTRPDGSVVTGDGTETPGSDTVVADAEGGFTYLYVLPLDISGVYDVDVLDDSGTRLASTFFFDSHYRGGTIKWERAPGGRVVTFTITSAWVSGPAHTLFFGDGGSTTVSGGTPIATSTDDVVHRYVIVHDYAAAGDGPFTATYSDCCRISGVQNSAGGFKATSVVDLRFGNDGSPVSGVPAVVQFVHGGLNTLSLPAADPQGDPFTFRLGTEAEAGGTYLTPSVGGNTLSIDSIGLMSWNTASTTVDQLWTVHAVIEETNNSSTTDLDFFIKIVDGTLNTPPTAAVDNASTNFTLAVGVPFSVDVIGSDADGDNLTINHLGLPVGASLSPVATTLSGQPFTGTFSWTPSSGDTGSTNVLTISFTDPSGVQAFASFTVTVPLNQTLTVTKAGAGTGTVTSTPSGISCGGTCAFAFTPGATVTLDATPASGSTFASWSGAGCSGTGSCVVTMDTAKSVTATFSLQDADLSITKTASPTTAQTNQNFTYTLTATNNGPDTATTVAISDPLPSGVAFVSADTGCAEAGGTVTCTAASLVNGASAAFDIIVTAPSTTGTISNTATVSAATPADSVSGNNSVTLNTTVDAPPPVPGITAWGMGVLALMLGAGAIFMRRRRATAS